MMRRLLLLALVPVLVGAGVLPALAATGTTNGPVLYAAGFRNYLQTPGSADKTDITSDFTQDFGPPAQFSPDGGSLAVVRNRCAAPCGDGDDVFDLEIRTHTGGVTTLTTQPGQAHSVTWAPDQSSVAVLVEPQNGTFDGTIQRVDVATGAVATVLATTSAFRVETDSDISWSPTGNQIAFVGTETFPDGHSYSVHTDQLYVVGATTGTKARFNPHQVEECDPEAPCPASTFRNPHWSPDGTRLLVLSDYDPDIIDLNDLGENEYSVATITQGSARATTVKAIPFGSFYTGPFWSPDATKILFSREVDGQLTGGVMSSSGGPVTDLAEWAFLDWQPCPDGACASWGTTTTVDSTISLNYRASTNVRLNGQVNPNRAGQSVTVRLDRQRANGSWVRVGQKSQALSALSRYVVTFPLQNVFSCRATAIYPGDASTLRSRSVKYFSC